MKRCSLVLMLAALLLASCKQKASDSKDVVGFVAETIAGKRPAVQAQIKRYNPGQSEGEILVFGSASEVLQLSDYLDTVDIHDNVDGFLFSDGLPDFCGETIARVIAVPSNLDDDQACSKYRTAMVKTTLTLMDTVALKTDAVTLSSREPGKMIVFTSPMVAELASCDLDSLFRALDAESPVIYASEQMEDTAKECYRELRRRNAFTHKISYPLSKSYVALPDSEGEYTIIDTDERYIQD
ncbi:MAG: hypothetical protein ACI3Y4_00135 [Candidatus Cryptobacteroides sp.]